MPINKNLLEELEEEDQKEECNKKYHSYKESNIKEEKRRREMSHSPFKLKEQEY